MPGSKRDGSLAQVKDEEKKEVIQATDPQRHATVPAYGQSSERAVDLSQQSVKVLN